MRQMTIFDFAKRPTDLDSLQEEEMVSIVGGAIGVEFVNKGDVWKWEARPNKKARLNIGYSNYTMRGNNSRFISCGYEYGNGGAGSPCDTIDEAIEFFRRYL